MGLIHAALAGFSTTLADTWMDYFVCESIDVNTLVVKATKRTGKGSSNKRGNENVITKGSKIVVFDGQAAIMVEQGVVIEVATEPGIYEYDAGTPGIFSSTFGQGLKDTFKEMWNRIKHGGGAAEDARVYYFNTKEILDNKFGTQNPIPFRMAYQDLGRSFTVGVRCNGIYSYKIVDPVLFYTNVCGNITTEYKRSEIDNTLKTEFIDALQPSFAAISASGIRYDELPLRQNEVKKAVNEELSAEWVMKRGLSVEKVAINSATISDEDNKRIQDFEDRAWNTNPANAAATLVEAQAQAMQNAASNPNGAAMGLFGMGMAQQAGGLNAQNLFNMSAQNGVTGASTAPAPKTEGGWSCSCGKTNTGKFCAECGKPKPADADGWTCSCGTTNKGKFCAECGKPKPSDAPKYRCDKCGWEPEDPFNPPKFCGECGDPFNDADIVK
ncbi:MAG: SPFH domain-containing protein [Ruminococcus sp.]|nr:SPFH domain-containing protein [Ruminococcus sp.]